MHLINEILSSLTLIYFALVVVLLYLLRRQLEHFSKRKSRNLDFNVDVTKKHMRYENYSYYTSIGFLENQNHIYNVICSKFVCFPF